MNDAVGVILAAGRGTRLRPVTLSRSKPSVPVGGTYPVVANYQAMIKAGISEDSIFVVVSDGSYEDVTKAFEFSRIRPPTLLLDSEVQGLARSLRVVTKHLITVDQNPSVLVLSLGDLISTDLAIDRFVDVGLDKIRSNPEIDAVVRTFSIPSNKISSYGIAFRKPSPYYPFEVRYYGFVEKPSAPPNDDELQEAIAGMYLFNTNYQLHKFDDLLANSKPNPSNGEYDLTQPLTTINTDIVNMDDHVLYDIRDAESLLRINKAILGGKSMTTTGEVVENPRLSSVTIEGQVMIDDESELDNVIIEDGSNIVSSALKDSYIGSQAYIANMRAEIVVPSKSKVVSLNNLDTIS